MASPSLDSIPNFLALSPTLGTAGQPTAEQFATLKEAGYAVIINLALPTSDNALPNEAELVTCLGLTHIQIPVVWESPTREDLQQFFAAMDSHRDRKVLVHCALNMRVSAFVYLYRVLREGVDPAVAQADLHRIWQPNPVWQQFIDQQLA